MTTTSPTRAPTRKRKIPWSTYADGRSWTLRRGVDYHSETHQAIHAARTWAGKNRYRLKVTGLSDGTGFTTTFTPRPDKMIPGQPHVCMWLWKSRDSIEGRTWDHYTCPGCEATMSQPIQPRGLL